MGSGVESCPLRGFRYRAVGRRFALLHMCEGTCPRETTDDGGHLRFAGARHSHCHPCCAVWTQGRVSTRCHAQRLAVRPPIASIASPNPPAPKPSSNLPPDITSRLAAALAITAGGRSGRQATSGKTRTRSVRARIVAINDQAVQDPCLIRVILNTDQVQPLFVGRPAPSPARCRGSPSPGWERCRTAACADGHPYQTEPIQRGRAGTRPGLDRRRGHRGHGDPGRESERRESEVSVSRLS
jgi:hypothetical protein